MPGTAEPQTSLEARLTAPNTSFSPNLDFLRSVAVLLVLIGHAAFSVGHTQVQGWPLAYLATAGVFMFFVHTSLVLLWSLQRKPYTIDFYIRRIFRVYPLAITATLAAVALHAPLAFGGLPYFQSAEVTWRNLLVNLLLIFNLFDPAWGFHQILHVEWSLPLELQMYVMLPVLYAFFRRESSYVPLVLLWVLAVVLCVYHGIQPTTFVGSIPNFLGGLIAFVAFRRHAPSLPSWLFPVYLLSLTAVLVHTDQLRFCWIYTALLGLGLPVFRPMRASWFTHMCNGIARYSYSVYLSHPFAIWLAMRGFASQPFALRMVVVLIATAVLSFIGYHTIEKPMIRLGARFAAKVEVRAQARGQLHAL